jgi:hypothetical protein
LQVKLFYFYLIFFRNYLLNEIYENENKKIKKTLEVITIGGGKATLLAAAQQYMLFCTLYIISLR